MGSERCAPLVQKRDEFACANRMCPPSKEQPQATNRRCRLCAIQQPTGRLHHTSQESHCHPDAYRQSGNSDSSSLTGAAWILRQSPSFHVMPGLQLQRHYRGTSGPYRCTQCNNCIQKLTKNPVVNAVQVEGSPLALFGWLHLDGAIFVLTSASPLQLPLLACNAERYET
ncbi:hypothetical protein C9890_0314 [Perkinsus sp. BL_2016]|nr:hypothetical protein C9890_0314 [Perkinsus sp. BL_2016]